MNKQMLIIGAAAAVGVLLLRSRARASSTVDAAGGQPERDTDRIIDLPPAETYAPSRTLGKGGTGDSVLTKIVKGTESAASGATKAIGAAVPALVGVLTGGLSLSKPVTSPTSAPAKPIGKSTQSPDIIERFAQAY